MDSGKILTLQIQPNLIDDMNGLASIIGVDVDVLVCDVLKMYLSAMKICTHRIIDAADNVVVVEPSVIS